MSGNAKVSAFVRLDPATYKAVSDHAGARNRSRAMRGAVERYCALVSRALPSLTAGECRALAGALRGWPDWVCGTAPRSPGLGVMLAAAVDDFREDAPNLAANCSVVDWGALRARCAAMNDAEVFAVCHAAEGVQWAGGALDDASLARFFRVAAAPPQISDRPQRESTPVESSQGREVGR